MAGQGGKDGHANDDAKYLIFIILIFALGWLVWVPLKPQFLWLTFGFDILQYKFLQILHVQNNQGLRWMSYVESVHSHLFGEMANKGPYGVNGPAHLTWEQFLSVQEDIGGRMRWFWLVIAAALSVLIIFKMRGDGYKRQYSLTGRSKKPIFRFLGFRIDNKFVKFILYWLCWPIRPWVIAEKPEWINTGTSFAMYQARHWREALTGAMFDPGIDNPNMRPALTPPEWMRENKISLKNGQLDEVHALYVLASQVGVNWTGLKSAPLYVQSIMVMSALNVYRDKGLEALRAALTECYVLRPKDVEKEIPKLLAPYLSNPKYRDKIEEKAANHAYTNTACIAVYGWGGPIESWGGKGGVLSSSLFLWLKNVDRPLWYALNNVGRRQFHVEGSGAVCQYFVEKLYRSPHQKTIVDNALQGIIKYLGEHSITDLDEHFNRNRD